MKFKDYVKVLEKTLKDFPETADYRVYYAVDDEGNDHKPLLYTPTIGFLDSAFKEVKDAIVIN